MILLVLDFHACRALESRGPSDFTESLPSAPQYESLEALIVRDFES